MLPNADSSASFLGTVYSTVYTCGKMESTIVLVSDAVSAWRNVGKMTLACMYEFSGQIGRAGGLQNFPTEIWNGESTLK